VAHRQLQQLLGHLQHRLAGHAGAQNNGQQLGIRQRGRTRCASFSRGWASRGRSLMDMGVSARLHKAGKGRVGHLNAAAKRL
jgi:hypothetical protein